MPDSPPTLSVTVAARRLGVAPDTLRTWDRRYGLGPSVRSAGARRQYTPNDFARLEVMRRLTLEGFPAKEAARVAQRLMVPAPCTWQATGDALLPGTGSETSDGTFGCSGEASRGDPPESARRLLRAALALDASGMAALMGGEIARRGVIPTWETLVVPVLTAVGRRWERCGLGIEVEHLLSETVLGSLREVSGSLRSPVNTRPVLAAGGPEEQHALPLSAFAAALAERQVEVRVLGARVPPAAMGAAVRRCGPAAVLVWSHDAATGCADAVGDLLAVRPAPTVLVGGPGWQGPLPEPVRRVGSLAEATEAVLRVVSRSGRGPEQPADLGPAGARRR